MEKRNKPMDAADMVLDEEDALCTLIDLGDDKILLIKKDI